MKVFNAPDSLIDAPKYKGIFLAGSIELGEAENWQQEAIRLLEEKFEPKAVTSTSVLFGWGTNKKYCVFNPRRVQWVGAKESTIDNVDFYRQVKWELDAMERAEFIILNFCGNTRSPISLLELGLHANKPNGISFNQKLHVICPDNFWRKGNVDIVCEHYKIPQHKNLTEAIEKMFNYG